MNSQDLLQAFLSVMRDASQGAASGAGKLSRGENPLKKKQKTKSSAQPPSPPPVRARVERGISGLVPQEKPLEYGGPPIEDILSTPDAPTMSVPQLSEAPPKAQINPAEGADYKTPIEIAHGTMRDEGNTPEAFSSIPQDPWKAHPNWTLGIGLGMGLFDIIRNMNQTEGKVGSSLAGYMDTITDQQKSAVEQRLKVESDMRQMNYEDSKERKRRDAEERGALRAHNFREEEATSQWNRETPQRETQNNLSKLQILSQIQQIQQRTDISPSVKAQILMELYKQQSGMANDPMMQMMNAPGAAESGAQAQQSLSALAPILGLPSGNPPPPSPTSSLEEKTMKVAAQRIMKSNGGKAPTPTEFRDMLKQLAAEIPNNPQAQMRILKMAQQMMQESLPRQ